MTVVIAPTYHLGSRPEMEMHVRNFLQQEGGLWTREAVDGDSLAPGQFHEGHHLTTLTRVLLLIFSRAREQDW